MYLFNLVLSSALFFAYCQQKNDPVPNNPPVNVKKFYKWDEFCMGLDLSYINQIEDKGGIYKDSGSVKDPYTIFSNHGGNAVRVRLWHTPVWELPLRGENYIVICMMSKKQSVVQSSRYGSKS
jgi:arabinogalactan endo-1,4-beta-galactosidase